MFFTDHYKDKHDLRKVSGEWKILFPSVQIMLEPVGSRRHDNVFTIDAKVEKEINLGDVGNLSAILDVFNLTNENTVLSRANFVTLPGFNMIGEVLSPRAFRIGLRYSF